MKLNGINAPDGDGIVLEVHLDVQRTTPEFTGWLENQGFENDPFATFFPTGYIAHMTGRLKVPAREIHGILPDVNALVTSVVNKAVDNDFALYAEVELVRDIRRFDPSAGKFSRSLDGLGFSRSGKFGGAKSDVHVEFPEGEVPPQIREYLYSKEFYWVSTPPTPQCGAEEIATLQTSVYDAGKHVFDLLCENPLPGCTAIHLEQKLSMIATNFNLAMPEVIDVKYR